jgi:hypothetical protein
VRQVGRVRKTRAIVGYAAVACALPYLALKIIWLTGGQLGVSDAVMMRDRSMVALNLVTAGMDLVAIGIALAFTHAWGLRIPAWLVLPPTWVATGLLGNFVVAVPVIVIADAIMRRALPRPAGGPVEGWVYAVVYTEFVGMGIGLMLAFLFYARTRWAAVFATPTSVPPPSPTRGVQVPLAIAGALMAAVVGALHLAWAFGATIGLPRELAEARTFSGHVLNTIDATTALVGAAAGVLLMVSRGAGQRVPFWVAATLTWIGSGSLFGWGLWQLINVLGNTALVRGRIAVMPMLNLLGLMQLLAGTVIGLVALFVLAERQASR